MERVPGQNGPQIPNIEKKRELAERIKALHERFETRIMPGWKEKDVIWKKYTGIVRPIGANFAEFMSPEDVAKYQKLYDEEVRFGHDTSTATREALDLLSQNRNAKWERMPYVGVPGSLSQTNSRHYQSKLDDSYSLEISWFDYPLDDGQVPESFRESYGARIVGSREVMARKGIGGWGRKAETRKFPLNTIGIGQDDNREFKFSVELQREFDEETRKKFQEQLLVPGKKLREQLG